MFAAAKESGINLCGVSGYRPYESQESLYNEKLKSLGQDYVDNYVAYPGQSEHQTGLAMDVGIQGVNSYDFGKSQEGRWVRNNAQYYGFIIRYPEEKQNITGCSYEPWHVRYVGKDAALTIKAQNLTLEEYLKRR
jgi:LAS superfamily LD-carboxypeptidase LdcB